MGASSLFVTVREICDITGEGLSKVCYDVAIDQLCSSLLETIIPATANRQDEAHADIQVSGFWW